MKLMACDLRIGETFTYKGKAYVPVSMSNGKLYALPIENFITIDWTEIIDTNVYSLAEEEN